ncbi:MAG TPA: ATP-binding cassette domain-containing protein, partial [Intrasporangium sp.]|nr:ATP-binding cassette domain-containing protein [Intrasporangium sp.]
MGPAVIRCEDVTKRFGTTEALGGVDLIVEAGDVFGYLGPNGAGKTTTLRLVMGMIRPTSGRVEVFGLDAWRCREAVHRRVGYLSGDVALYDRLSGQDHVDYVGHLHGLGRPPEAGALAERLGLDLRRPARELSRGKPAERGPVPRPHDQTGAPRARRAIQWARPHGPAEISRHDLVDLTCVEAE